MLRVGVADALPAYRRGLMSILADAGICSDEPAKIVGWARDVIRSSDDVADARICAVIGLHDEVQSDQIVALSTHAPAAAVVALLPDPSIADYGRALTIGATSATAYSAEPDEIVSVIRAAAHDATRLPQDIAYALACKACKSLCLSPFEATTLDIEILRTLAKGTSVTTMARLFSFSDRSMFRSLNKLYERMGVTSRSEAVARAVAWDLIEGA